MVSKRIEEVKRKIEMRRVIEKLNTIEEVKFIEIIEEKSSNWVKYNNLLRKVNSTELKAEFHKVFDKDKKNPFIEQVKNVYDFMKISDNKYDWVIPYYGWMLRIEVLDVEKFVNKYYSKENKIYGTIIDVRNNFVFDIGIMEQDYEIYIVRF